MSTGLRDGFVPEQQRPDVLRAAEAGSSTNDIAHRLALAPTTVRNYLSNAIAKTGARSRLDAMRIAREAGWL